MPAPPVPAATEGRRSPDGRLAARLFGYVRPWRGLVAAAVGLIVLQSGLQLVGPLLTRWVIDEALPARDRDGVLLAAVGFAVVLVLQFAATYGQTMATALLGQRVMRQLRGALFAHLQRLPVGFFDRTPVGRLVTRTTSDVESLNELFTSGVVAGLGDLVTLVAIGVVMVSIDPWLALAAFAVIPLVVLVSRVFQARVRAAYREIRAALARLNAFVQERLAGVRVVQLFGREAQERTRFADLNDAHLDAHLRSIRVYALYFPAIEFLTTVALASLLLTSGARIADGAITVGTVAAFLQLVRRFFQPLQDLSEKYNILQAAMAAAERMFELLDTPADAGTQPSPDRAARVRALREAGVTVTFEHVWFRYARATSVDLESPRGPVADADADEPGAEVPESAAPWVLRDISFTAGPGDTVALVGHTGAGKSTIVNLLLRFYEPQRGRILLNGVDIRELPLDVLRSVMGYVQQDIFLFAGDVAGNLRLSTARTDAELASAAARVGADRVIARLPGGWTHELAERGAGISVGERQLLAFARAVVADPALLILDEATSAVDSAVEAEIQRAVSALMQGRTTIAIAHRLSTIQGATQILVLHHGEVVERGDHQSLLAAGGLYERLSRLERGATARGAPAASGPTAASTIGGAPTATASREEAPPRDSAPVAPERLPTPAASG
ncbi:MAG TPA: ABC transporter transmembrane domain-containing protein [Gemmatimonadaceae bacterium]|nr:ABC transporter transmembrane domain-containing protein [Gemmatimonadaceae bacterium]